MGQLHLLTRSGPRTPLFRLRFEDWVYDGDVRQLFLGESPVHLTPKAFDLLGALLEARPKALSKAEIYDRLWPQTFVSDATLASVVSELRGALGDDPKAPRFVRTVHGHGYAFSGEATADEPSPASPAAGRHLGLSPILAVVVALIVFAFIQKGRREDPGRASDSGPRSLAVLPLRDLSIDGEQAYFADGLTESLMASLARVGALRVVSRTSVMQYKGKTGPMPEIARELGADLLVDGSARRAGGRVRLTARLVDGARDREVWSRTYEEASDDAAQLPDRIARDIAEAARLALPAEQQARLAAVRPVDPAAYDSYLRGRYQLARGSVESNRKAIELLQEALERDPRYAPGYAQLANAYNTLGTVWVGERPREMRALAAAAAQKALEIDPDFADAHTYLGTCRLFDWDFAGAEHEFLRAIELDPSSGTAHAGYSRWLLARGRMDEAVAETRKSQELDPLSVTARRGVGFALFHARRYDEAVAHLQGVAATEPRDAFTHWFLAESYGGKGRYEEAVAEARQAVLLSERSPAMVGHLANKLARAGRREEARALVTELHETARRRYVSPAGFVVAYAGLGEREEALRWLERGFEERVNLMVYLNSMECLDPLRHDPRFRALVARIGLPN